MVAIATIQGRSAAYWPHVATRNEELTKRAFDALGERGVEAIPEFVHPEFEMTTLPGQAAEPQTYRGHEGLRRWFDTFYEVMDEIAIEPSTYEEVEPDRVLLEFTLRAKGQASGIEVTQEARAIATVREERLARLEFLLNDDAPA
jgi:ketosteroid isomerase-like protein